MEVGTVVVPRASVFVHRNYDFDFLAGGGAEGEQPYRFSKPVSGRRWERMSCCVSTGVLMCSVLGSRRRGASCRGTQEAD